MENTNKVAKGQNFRTLGKNSAVVVREGELDTPHWLRNARNCAARLRIKPSHWLDTLTDWNRDYDGLFVHFKAKHKLRDPAYSGVFLRMQVFERPGIEDWFEEFLCTPVPDEVRPHVRREARARAKVALTLLRMTYPVAASTWPLEPANTNRPPRG